MRDDWKSIREKDFDSNRLTGIHAVEEALLAGQPLSRIAIARGTVDRRIQKIIELARARHVPVRFENRAQLDRISASEHHQGVMAFLAAQRTLELEDLLATCTKSCLLVVLDGIEDPHNVGAIIRTSLASGAAGLILPERRAAGLTETVARVSAGGLAHLPVACVKNLARAMEQLKQAEFWLIGLDERAEKPYTGVDYNGRIAIVLGNESRGLHELVRKHCDFLVSIPTTGPVRSLNVSVAAGIVLFEAVRQRRLSQSLR
jgi:23S rRNA (guanosine2251-2'-O)-methyltransferase